MYLTMNFAVGLVVTKAPKIAKTFSKNLFREIRIFICRGVRGLFQWPRGLRLGSAAARLLRLRVRSPPEAWISFCCEFCVLSGRGLCDGPITRPEVSYRR